MENKNSLYLSKKFLQLLKLLLAVLFSAFAVTIIYSLIQPGAFGSVVIQKGFDAGFGIGSFKVCPNCIEENYLTIKSLSSFMKIWLLIRGTLFLVLIFLIIQKIEKIVASVQSNTTFYEGNEESFRILSKYGWLLAILSSFNFLIQNDISNLNFSIPFGAIAFSLGCASLANIFREGKELTDDKNSII